MRKKIILENFREARGPNRPILFRAQRLAEEKFRKIGAGVAPSLFLKIKKPPLLAIRYRLDDPCGGKKRKSTLFDELLLRARLYRESDPPSMLVSLLQ